MVELLLDGASVRTPPREEELHAWAEAYDLPMTTVGPVDDRARQVFADREWGYIIELETMTVVWTRQALYSSPTISDFTIDAFLSEFR